MSLTHTDIEWCSPDNDETKIIFSCGSFPNIPLIGTKGGISYNPALARCQYGYPMKNIPSDIQLEGLFFKNIDDHGNMLKKEIVPSLASCTQQREKIVRKTSLHLPGSLPSMGTRQSIQAQDAISTSRTYSPKGTNLPFLHRC